MNKSICNDIMHNLIIISKNKINNTNNSNNTSSYKFHQNAICRNRNRYRCSHPSRITNEMNNNI